MARKRASAEPQWYQSQINVPVYNYGVYHLTTAERIFYCLVAFSAGGFVGYLFFGGLGLDEAGNSTTTTLIANSIAVAVGGIFAVRVYLPARTEQIRRAKVRVLDHQFRDMLDSLSGSLSAGSTLIQSFSAARDDLRSQYSDDAPIVHELDVILSGFHNNIRIEDMIHDFGVRSGSPDIASFANVFHIAYMKGGDMKEAIRNTHLILSEKMSMTAEIETSLAGSKNESLIMIVLPIVLVGMLKGSGSSFSEALATPAGLVCTVLAVGMFAGAYALSRKIMEIKL